MSNEAVISGGLNALMLLQRGMEEMQKNPPAQQGPAGPTVAMQAQQAAQQAVAGQPPQDPSAPPPPGQPQPQENGIAGIAQNVGTGAQIQAQQQQQAQQAMMAQAQQAQRPPQQIASGGIAGLNTQNMRGCKDGGVMEKRFLKPRNLQNLNLHLTTYQNSYLNQQMYLNQSKNKTFVNKF